MNIMKRSLDFQSENRRFSTDDSIASPPALGGRPFLKFCRSFSVLALMPIRERGGGRSKSHDGNAFSRARSPYLSYRF